MAKLSDLEAEQARKLTEHPPSLEDGGDLFDEEESDAMRQDLLDCMTLLTKCAHMFFYVADPELCKSVTKKERESMAGLSTRISTFLDNMAVAYSEEED